MTEPWGHNEPSVITENSLLRPREPGTGPGQLYHRHSSLSQPATWAVQPLPASSASQNLAFSTIPQGFLEMSFPQGDSPDPPPSVSNDSLLPLPSLHITELISTYHSIMYVITLL